MGRSVMRGLRPGAVVGWAASRSGCRLARRRRRRSLGETSSAAMSRASCAGRGSASSISVGLRGSTAGLDRQQRASGQVELRARGQHVQDGAAASSGAVRLASWALVTMLARVDDRHRAAADHLEHAVLATITAAVSSSTPIPSRWGDWATSISSRP